MACEAQRCNDQMQCGRCGLAWDVADPEPPKCGRKIDRRAIPERAVTRAVTRMETAPVPLMLTARIYTELPADLAREMLREYRKGRDAVAGMQLAYAHFVKGLG